jgi:hypothetical protein
MLSWILYVFGCILMFIGISILIWILYVFGCILMSIGLSILKNKNTN